MKITKTAIGNHLRRSPNGDVGMYRNGFKDGVNWTLQKAQAQAADCGCIDQRDCTGECMKKAQTAKPGDIRALKHRIHELEGEVIGYKRIFAEHDEAIAAARVAALEEVVALCDPDALGLEQDDDCATGVYRVEKAIRALIGKEAT